MGRHAALVVDSDFQSEYGRRVMRQLLDRPGRPDAVVLAGNPMALGVLAEVTDQGLRPASPP